MRLRKLLVVLGLGLGLLGWQAAPLLEPRAAQAQGFVQQSMVDFAFEPAELVVPAGTTVVWSNDGATIHTVAPADLTWSSPVLQPGETYAYTFTTPGLYPVLCTIHPDMQVTIQVE